MAHNFKFNHDDEQRREYEILEPGWYDFKINASYDKDGDGNALVTKNARTPYLKFQCEELDSGVILGGAAYSCGSPPTLSSPSSS